MSQHEAAEEQYFWPAVREKVSDGDSLAAGGIAAPPSKTRTTRSIADSIPPEALMRFGFIRPGNRAQAIASQRQPVASELVPALREAAAAERGRSRTEERP